MIEDMLTAPVPAWVVVVIVAGEVLLQITDGTLGASNSVAKEKKSEEEE